jgi:D-threo-aldose 1-dehydrogenase
MDFPRIGLGTAALGGLFAAVDDEAAARTIDRAWERGIRFFDTAPLYGHGLSERRVGRALAGRPRDEFVLSTKIGRLLREGAPADPGQSFWKGAAAANPVFDFSGEGAVRSLEESLERLGLGRIDIVLIHDPDDHQDEALRGAYPALARLREEGVVRAVGVGTNRTATATRLAQEADLDCVLLAGRYTLLDRSAADVLPLLGAVIAGGVFNSGLLAGGATFDYEAAPLDVLQRVAELRAVCEAHGVPLKAAALQFPLRHPAVTSLLLGPRSAAELDENLDLLEATVPDELWGELR